MSDCQAELVGLADVIDGWQDSKIKKYPLSWGYLISGMVGHTRAIFSIGSASIQAKLNMVECLDMPYRRGHESPSFAKKSSRKTKGLGAPFETPLIRGAPPPFKSPADIVLKGGRAKKKALFLGQPSSWIVGMLDLSGISFHLRRGGGDIWTPWVRVYSVKYNDVIVNLTYGFL